MVFSLETGRILLHLMQAEPETQYIVPEKRHAPNIPFQSCSFGAELSTTIGELQFTL